MLAIIEKYKSDLGLKKVKIPGKAGGFVAKIIIDGSADEVLTSIYRAVGPDEFYKVMDTGEFEIDPNGFGGKQFGLNLQETMKFAEWAPDASAIIEVKISKSVLKEIADTTHVDTTTFRSGTVTIHAEHLSDFNNAIRQIIHVY